MESESPISHMRASLSSSAYLFFVGDSMEAIGAGASVVAFLSIAIQLQEAQKQMLVALFIHFSHLWKRRDLCYPLLTKGSCTLIRSIKEAPNEVQSILAEVELMGAILKEIQWLGETSDSTQGAADNTLKSALERSRRAMDSLHSLAQNLVDGLNSKSRLRRKITAIEVARKSEKIKKFREILQTTKFDLSLLQLNLVM